MKKDIFAESRRLSEISKKVRNVFERWNYDEIFLPSIEEHSDDLRKGFNASTGDRFYLIKPDVTSQIVRNIKGKSTRRLYYVSEVLNGIESEWQSGIEFIGGESELDMQVETLSIVIECLEALEIENYYIDISDLKLWEDVLNDVEEHRTEVLEALLKRNFGIIDEMPLSEEKKDEMWELFNYRSNDCDIEGLKAITETLDDDRVFVDFGTIRPLSYYEDIIFEVYSPYLGYPIGAGGGYTVNGTYAFGFAFKLEKLMNLLFSSEDRKRRNNI